MGTGIYGMTAPPMGVTIGRGRPWPLGARLDMRNSNSLSRWRPMKPPFVVGKLGLRGIVC